MLERFKEHLNERLPFLENSNLLIAISGGIDSVVLTHLLHKLNKNITLAHCNFHLRGEESDTDESFVKKLGAQLEIPVLTTHFDTSKFANEKGISIQMAARDLRYNWFQEILEKHDLEYILTAHHKDDSLETFLINFTRGTGLDGLTGIPEINENTIRPLLPFSRKEIENFAKENSIEWREDQSNTSTKYFRNKIRHEIVPILKELNPNFLKSFDKTLNHLSESQAIISDRIVQLKKHVISTENEAVTKISINKVLELNNSKAHLYELLKEYGFTSWKDISSLLKAQSGKQLFSKKYRLIKNRDELLITKLETPSNDLVVIPTNNIEINTPISLTIGTAKSIETKNNFTAYIDRDLIQFPLVVRKWQKGDYFYPIGMVGKKKVSKYFKDIKLSLLEKEQTWLLCDNNKIIWIVGKRLDNRYKVTEQTKSILKIEYSI